MILRLKLLPGLFAVCRLPPEEDIPAWAMGGGLLSSVTRTPEELSIVCAQSLIPNDAAGEKGWRCLKIQGPLPFELTGVLASLAGPLARAGIGLFAVSTYDTDYILVKEAKLDTAIRALGRAGHFVEGFEPQG